MNNSLPVKLVFPSIALVGIILFSLSAYTGSVYTKKQINPIDLSRLNPPALSANYPDSIQQWGPAIQDCAQQYGLDPNLIAAVMLQESGGQAEVISSSGAVGLMQVMPKDGTAAAFMCGSNPCFINRPTTAELLRPDFNIKYGTRMLANLIREEGSLEEALFKYGPMDVGYDYANIVLAIYERY